MPNDASNRVARVRRDRITALIALTLLAAVAFYQVWDVRIAFTDFNSWWAFIKPTYPGDDYAQAVVTAERQDDWYGHYRAISMGMAVKHASDKTVRTIVRPVDLWTLWGESETAAVGWDHPDISPDYFGWISAQATKKSLAYDPVLPADTIAAWQAEGRVHEQSWGVAWIADDTRDATEVVLMTDPMRATVYVVPASLAPAGDR